MPDDRFTRFDPGAFDFVSKTVPLVIYDADGERKVIGEATLTPDETGLDIESKVTDPEVANLIAGKDELSGFAIYNQPFRRDIDA